jgi:hypothetical protein
MVLMMGVQAGLDVTPTEMVPEWVSMVPVPVIVNAYVPGVVWQVGVIVSVEDAVPPLDTETLVGFRLALAPEGGAEVERVTAPFHQFWAVTLTRELTEEPCATLNEFGTERWKSAIIMVMTAVW